MKQHDGADQGDQRPGEPNGQNRRQEEVSPKLLSLKLRHSPMRLPLVQVRDQALELKEHRGHFLSQYPIVTGRIFLPTHGRVLLNLPSTAQPRQILLPVIDKRRLRQLQPTLGPKDCPKPRVEELRQQ